MQYIIFPALLLLMYALVIRPQQQRVREQQRVVATIEVGDHVLSSAGIFGFITALDEEVAVLEVAPGVEIRLARGAIARKVAEPGDIDLTDIAPEAPADGHVQDPQTVEED